MVRIKVDCTEPTLPLMVLLQTDSVKIAKNNGTYLPYESRDVSEVIKHCITLPYGKPTDISPDITITLNNAGHIMGSATVHLNISGQLTTSSTLAITSMQKLSS